MTRRAMNDMWLCNRGISLADIAFPFQMVPMVLEWHTTELQCDRLLPPHHRYATTLGAHLTCPRLTESTDMLAKEGL